MNAGSEDLLAGLAENKAVLKGLANKYLCCRTMRDECTPGEWWKHARRDHPEAWNKK